MYAFGTGPLPFLPSQYGQVPDPVRSYGFIEGTYESATGLYYTIGAWRFTGLDKKAWNQLGFGMDLVWDWVELFYDTLIAEDKLIPIYQLISLTLLPVTG